MLMVSMQNIKRAVDVQTVVQLMLNVRELLDLDVKELQMNEENGRAFVLGFEAGEAAERERIIKLLEELKEFWSEKMTLEYGEATMINVDEAIALIKGGNK